MNDSSKNGFSVVGYRFFREEDVGRETTAVSKTCKSSVVGYRSSVIRSKSNSAADFAEKRRVA